MQRTILYTADAQRTRGKGVPTLRQLQARCVNAQAQRFDAETTACSKYRAIRYKHCAKKIRIQRIWRQYGASSPGTSGRRPTQMAPPRAGRTARSTRGAAAMRTIEMCATSTCIELAGHEWHGTATHPCCTARRRRSRARRAARVAAPFPNCRAPLQERRTRSTVLRSLVCCLCVNSRSTHSHPAAHRKPTTHSRKNSSSQQQQHTHAHTHTPNGSISTRRRARWLSRWRPGRTRRWWWQRL